MNFKLNFKNDKYQIGDVIFTIADGSLIKTKIIKVYPNHIGVYSGNYLLYEKIITK